ncbi:MAG: Crp/Fnr family transcriptional regulator [Gemmatimonadaceae bacterium]
MVTPELLARLGMFNDVGPCVVPTLAARALSVAFGPGEVIFLAGSEPRGWFIIIEGLVRVVQGTGARQHVVHSEGAGGTLGEVPFFSGGRHPATGIAAEPTRCVLFDRASLEAAIAECPEIAFVMTRRLALRTHALVLRLNERSAKSVRIRLVEFLLERATSAGSRRTFSIGMTQQELAEELGTVREVISREIRRLSGDGLLAPIGGGRYEIADLPGMQHAASADD